MNIVVTVTNPALMRKLAEMDSIVSIQPFKAPANGHKFAPQDRCILHGLQEFSEFNGQTVTIAAIREDGPRGRAYYIEGEEGSNITRLLNWVYEYRLRKVETP